MKIKWKALLIMMLVVLVELFICREGYAAGKPLAELYFASHGDVGGLLALHTDSFKSETTTEFSNAGYSASAYTKAPAGPRSQASIMRTIDDDAIVMLNMHAGKGRMCCVDNYNNITRLSAAAVDSDSSNYSLAYNFDGTTNKLKSVRLAVFWGCNSYGTDTKYGNLTTKATSLGVDCVVTHSGKTYTPYSAYFTYQFAKYLNQKKTVSQALSNAREACFNKYGGRNDTTSNRYISVSNYKIGGASSNPGSLKMKPAAYGTY